MSELCHEFGTVKGKEHWLPMRGTEYFDYIISGEKKFEGRVYASTCRSMQVGDHLRMFDKRANWGIICRIVSTNIYSSFDAMLRDKGTLAMLPQLRPVADKLTLEQLIAEGVKIYKGFPGASRVTQNGAIAIGVEFIGKIHE